MTTLLSADSLSVDYMNILGKKETLLEKFPAVQEIPNFRELGEIRQVGFMRAEPDSLRLMAVGKGAQGAFLDLHSIPFLRSFSSKITFRRIDLQVTIPIKKPIKNCRLESNK